jgi:ATP-dependent protease ClpP protease subunit
MRRDLRSKATLPVNRAPATASKRWFEFTNLAENGVAEIKLRGYIGMPTTERDWMTGELVATGGAGTLQEFEAGLEALGPVKKIQLSIFSEGGDVFTGMAIHNLLVRHPAKKTCVIDGICASAATYPALACQEIQIPANAWMMIHGSEGCCCGNAQEMRDYADLLDSVNASIVNLYAARTGKSPAEITTMIEDETWMDGAKAVEMGFADTVIEPLANLASRAATIQPTNAAVLRNAPAEVLALFDMSAISNAARAPLPMLKPNTPLFNAATDSPPTGGSGAPAQPAAAAAPAPAPAPPLAPAAPVNAAPDLATQITNAVQAAVAPLQAEVKRLTDLSTHGITPQNLGGAQPVAGAVAPEAPTNTMKRDEWSKQSPHNRAEFIKKGGKLID